MLMQIRVKAGACLNKSHEAMRAHTNCNAQHISSVLYKSFYYIPLHTQHAPLHTQHAPLHTQHACKMKKHGELHTYIHSCNMNVQSSF